MNLPNAWIEMAHLMIIESARKYGVDSTVKPRYNDWSVPPIQKPRCIVRYFRSQTPVPPKYNDNLAISLNIGSPEPIVISRFDW